MSTGEYNPPTTDGYQQWGSTPMTHPPPEADSYMIGDLIDVSPYMKETIKVTASIQTKPPKMSSVKYVVMPPGKFSVYDDIKDEFFPKRGPHGPGADFDAVMEELNGI